MALKLFFISGTPWLFEIFALVFISILEEDSVLEQSLSYFFKVITTLNSLRGIAIFIFFVLLQQDPSRYLWQILTRLIPSIRSKSNIAGLSGDGAGSISFNLDDQSISGVSQLTISTPSVMLDEEQGSGNQRERQEDTSI